MYVALATPISLRSFGGAERKILEAAKLLVEKGNNVRIYALPFTHSYGSKLTMNDLFKELDVEYHEGKNAIIKADAAYLVYAPIIWRMFKFSCPTIAGLHSPLLFPSKEGFKTFSNPILITKYYRSPVYALSFWFSFVLKNWDLSAFDAVRILTPYFNIKHKRIFCIPDWVNSEIFKPRSKKKSKNFIVFFAGRHHWEKGFDVFLKVASLLDKKRYNIKFICTGKGFGPVEGTGFLNDEELAQAYSEAHLVLYPSRMDVLSATILESSACGTPVATTPIPAHLLNLPLFYATTVKEYVEIVIKVYNLYFNETEKYYRLSSELHEKAMYYSTEEIFPKFEFMLKSVSEKNE